MITAVCMILFYCNIPGLQDLAKNVNTFTGTDGPANGWNEGHCFPGPSMPFGMVRLSPDNRDDAYASYYRNVLMTIRGFSHTHLSGAGPDEGPDFCVMPTVGKIQVTPGIEKDTDTGYRSKYRKETETASPGYYSVLLDDYNVKAELTATKRVGVHRYTFPESKESNILIDLRYGVEKEIGFESNVKITGENEISGFRRVRCWSKDKTVYFVAKFSKPFTSFGVAQSGKIDWQVRDGEGHNLQSFVRFDTKEGEQIVMKLALSYVDVEGARKNLEAEVKGFDFDKTKKRTRLAWNKILNKVQIEGATPEQDTTFYTAMYHTFLGAYLFSDVDGRYRGWDKKIHNSDHDVYNVFSLWDTYRGEHPWLALIEPKRTVDFINTFEKMYDEMGHLPVWELAGEESWIMIGYHSVSVIADAYMKGLRGFDANKLLNASVESSNREIRGSEYYKRLGYVPEDKVRWSVSKTLEYSYDDWCIAEMAKDLGETELYDLYTKRAQLYKNHFNPKNGFMHARSSITGEIPDPDKAVAGSRNDTYCESGSWQYRWYVPQDIDGLISLYGGDEQIISDLDVFFDKGQSKPDNEVTQHVPYIYNYMGAPWKTQERVRDLVVNKYGPGADGLPGNDDLGQLSAWYVMSALGFYTVCPGANDYIIGSPLFPKATINLENGKKFVIKTINNSKENIYVQSAKLNGEEYTKSFIKHSDIIAGGEIVFEMGATPNKAWGNAQSDRPRHYITEECVRTPIVKSKTQNKIGSKTISIESETKGAEIYYTTDGSIPDKSSLKFDKEIDIHKSRTIKAVALKAGLAPSFISETTIEIKTDKYPEVKVNSGYSHGVSSYMGDIGDLLMDGYLGLYMPYYGMGRWIMFNKNADVLIDFGKPKDINHIKLHFSAYAGGIESLEYLVSDDNKNFKRVSYTEFDTNPYELLKEKKARFIDQKVKHTKARYLKLLATPLKETMLEGAKYSSRLMISEIIVE
jgi:predicted alpha-1,2-mannosidase